MLGLMQEWPLLCHKIIDHAANFHGDREIVTRTVEGPVTRTNYRDMRRRSLKLAKRLEREGARIGDRIATMAWNTSRHLESWYGITGIGAVYHTLNPRLFPDQIAWIINDAEDKFLFVDTTFLPIIEAIADKTPSIKKVFVLTDAENMPETKLDNAVCYEEWLDETDDDFAWRRFDERTAAGMCYTSGTTGDPKGVLYSHRSNVLHSMVVCQPDMMNLSARDRMMPVVPFFHANGWATAFTCPLVGSTMVLPGAGMDGESLYNLLNDEKVTITAAVPTIWLMLLQYLENSGNELPYLERVVIGGSACPRAITQTFQEKYEVEVIHAWGMTEMSPLGSMCTIKPEYEDLTGEEKLDLQQKQGHPPFTVEMKVTDDENNELPWDSKSFGRLKVRGPAVAAAYYKNRGEELFDNENWFDTGDVAHMDPHGYMEITDRAKDVIKSGGEWISTIELENLAVGHEDVAEAAVIGIAHPKWDERPLLIIVPKEGHEPKKDDLLKYLEDKVAKWWLPNDVVTVEEIPHTATGKIQKTALREQFKDYSFPTE
ncbi:long-chain-fatty-acid--CoA ligase [Hoeflea sp. WL0058]|uniref:3-methylmercaptopropionyl-CoA ligase n=1 Tax=Flavimaribacter sediminis TaxID=2865987 RepID=A0AAE2ZIZ2_9HYPH|nr:long-chain-fatty-acid--CoA ligase [Flavimaribacter sediminis]MBW8637368.1 long-chain-fatty-acid--CoA ligase [Flavimaribacter sediminis]